MGWPTSPLALGAGLERAGLLVALSATFLAVLALGFARSRALYGGDEMDRDARTNCPSCGARVSADADACDHCGSPLRR
jgi:hypothetical protein